MNMAMKKSEAVPLSVTPRDLSTAIASVGRRKTAIARVRLLKNGSGTITVNRRPCDAYFTTHDARVACRQPLEAVGQEGRVDIEARIVGGGIHAQADALRLGIARALCKLNPTFQRALRKVGHLTRDARIKERKKPGLKRARRAPQWAKR
jgi:small subunit ribosomal protein S9